MGRLRGLYICILIFFITSLQLSCPFMVFSYFNGEYLGISTKTVAIDLYFADFFFNFFIRKVG